ncbi:hypothetical protein COU49_02050 [Candidatus Nomurabacteria bacterium CG10_big_fil_rev_8_21_14_0_10_35_16]|uniref:Uncharacterized protein n=1 Tax=Candidatus Nomurabacteria bacterium CG10_big_fil_rev_8_21_14_0_10_35_16 TaxID=1974731 RepID=A0A2H0TCW7_9BACT|nr:MAG: hypothetical protein COU49_02050 [Candidatus Nomurabacteria bacterium CG10_big_fil_rev_8_21_14_0_10_35_16]
MEDFKTPTEGQDNQIEFNFDGLKTPQENQDFATNIRRKMLSGEKLTEEEQDFIERDHRIFGKDNDPWHPEV